MWLESVKRQNRLPDEVIIGDDGSGDETAALIREFQKDFPVPLLHVWQEDKGFRVGKIRNKCIAKAKIIDFLVNLSYEKQIINNKRYIKFGESIDEIIKYLVGWKKSIKNQ